MDARVQNSPIRLRPVLFFVLALVLFAYAFSNNVTTAGLGFDILGALFLLWGEMKPEATLERYSSETSPEAHLHLAQRMTLPYHERFPLWVARITGSKEIMDMSQDSVQESFATKFWALFF